MRIFFEDVKIITPTKTIQRGTIVVGDDGKIAFIGPSESAPKMDGTRLNIGDHLIIPGFIDIHTHGGTGITFGEENIAAGLTKYSKWVARSGVTGFLTSITAPTPEELVDKIQAIVGEFKKGLPGAQGLGIHLEGPFMNIEKKGAQNPDWIRNPSFEETEMYLDAGEGWIKQVTIAPELPGASEVAARFANNGVVVAVGHSTADYETAVQAIESHWSLITHTFNAQTGFHHRKPGIVGAVLSSDDVTAELIADTIHVHPGAMKVLVRCLGSDRIILVTDAMEAAGLPDGTYHLLGKKVIVQNGKATQEDGTIASSTALLNQCVRNMNQVVGVDLPDSIKMASINAARVIGEEKVRGSIAPGKQADLTVIDDDLNIYMTIVNGEIVYSQ